MNVLQNVAYTAKATATGGREGVAKSDDGRLDVNLSTPKGLGGDDGQGTNPEQLFAAGYAACFIGALKFVAGSEKVALPSDTYINSEVSIGAIEGGFGIAVKQCLIRSLKCFRLVAYLPDDDGFSTSNLPTAVYFPSAPIKE